MEFLRTYGVIILGALFGIACVSHSVGMLRGGNIVNINLPEGFSPELTGTDFELDTSAVAVAAPARPQQ